MREHWDIPKHCKLDDAEFQRFRRRTDIERFEEPEGVTSHSIRSCRNWFLETLPEINKRDFQDNLFTLEACIWKLGNYVSCAKQMPHRETLLQPKTRARKLAIQIIVEWLCEDVPEECDRPQSVLTWMRNRESLMLRTLAWAREVKDWYPLGTQGHGRFHKKNIRDFAKHLELALLPYVETHHEHVSCLRSHVAYLPEEGLLF